ncbi:MAG: response regulator transcription factor [Caldilineaceae bacterium]|nr:response regulator transcription factor [Caldilineaceae bacterium]
MRLLWFRTTHAQQPKVATLLNRFDSEGMEIQVIESVDESAASVNKMACELIMLECINTVEQDMLVRLNRVRANSRVPLIVLTDNHTLDWSLIALREGADAIFTLNTPDDIIIARSNALLRRWLVD